MKELYKQLSDAGWKQVRLTKHVTWESPDGRRITLPLTPKLRGNSGKNIAKKVEKAIAGDMSLGIRR